MTAKQAHGELKRSLASLYDQREASVMAEWVMEEITGKSRMDRLMHDAELTPEQEDRWQQCLDAMVAGKPLQYVLGYAWFMGQRFQVNEHVLIPRPETEELVQWLLEELPSGASVLDIGTGSGCIPVMIKKLRPDAHVSSIDISGNAIAVARENAESAGVDVNFINGDFLNTEIRESLPNPDIIISNPPYIPFKDAATMHKNVVEYEPHLALFVPDNDVLVFYRAIISYATAKNIRYLYFETHYQLAGAVAEEGRSKGYTAELRKDLAGNDRMVCLKKSHLHTFTLTH